MMEDRHRFLDVVDVEATCWSGQSPAGQVDEIVEIDLSVVDTHTHERVSRHGVLVRPERSARSAPSWPASPRPRWTAASPSPPSTWAWLVDEHRSRSRTWASRGDYDRRRVGRQCRATGVRYPFGARHVNAEAGFARAHALPRRPGMVQALRVTGLSIEGAHHRGAGRRVEHRRAGRVAAAIGPVDNFRGLTDRDGKLTP